MNTYGSRYKEITDLYLSGKSYREIVQETGVSNVTVMRALKKFGITPRKGPANKLKLSDEEVGKIIQEYETGKPVDSIAPMLGYSTTVVKRVLGENSIVIRPKGFYNKFVGRSGVEKKIIEEFKENPNITQLSKKYGYSRTAIAYALHRNGFNAEAIKRQMSYPFVDRFGQIAYMRSSEETRVAGYLDEYELDWSYDPVLIRYNGNCKYSPDFLVRDSGEVRFALESKSSQYLIRGKRASKTVVDVKDIHELCNFLGKKVEFIVTLPSNAKYVIAGISSLLKVK